MGDGAWTPKPSGILLSSYSSRANSGCKQSQRHICPIPMRADPSERDWVPVGQKLARNFHHRQLVFFARELNG